jgi:hypothetical protein
MGRATQAGGSIARLTVRWSDIAPSRPLNAADPADPTYDFSVLDGAVRDATARGLNPILMILTAPAWAEGSGRPGNVPPGTWRPDPGAYGQFATAVARRYSGTFSSLLPPLGPLPRVTLFQAWNEPNLSEYLTPQWQGRKPVGARHYRTLLNSFYAAVKSVRPDNTVITAGTSPYGDPPGGTRSRPVRFWRDAFCLTERKRRKGRKGAKRGKQRKLKRQKCPKSSRASFDVLAHHPINIVSGPNKPAVHRDDASSADLGRVTRVLRAAERFRTVRPRTRHPIWATETWWETNPLDPTFGVPPVQQAYRLQRALYLIWKGGGSVALNLQVGDSATHQFGEADQNGVFLANGTPKPSFTAFRFPFVGDRLNRKLVRAWGKSPVAGTLLIQRARGGSWRTLRRISVGAGQVFAVRLKLRKRAVLRATVAGETSLSWTQK